MADSVAVQRPDYLLGHSPGELQRLADQADYFGDLTAHVFDLAGLRAGMRVLDAGSGTGDVAMLAARMVGPEGIVTGVDMAPDAVRLARRRAAESGLANVRFLEADLTDLQLDEPVDALVGRLVLMYFPDPAVALRRLASQVRPGGIIVFQELDVAGATSLPRCELFETTVQRIRETSVRAGIDFRIGLRLGAIFEDAGLPSPEMLLCAHVERGYGSRLCEQVARITRTLMPVMQQTRVATPADIDIDTLADRLRAEVIEQGATIVTPSFIGAWTTKLAPAG